jgi:hypothetical protein
MGQKEQIFARDIEEDNVIEKCFFLFPSCAILVDQNWIDLESRGK